MTKANTGEFRMVASEQGDWSLQREITLETSLYAVHCP